MKNYLLLLFTMLLFSAYAQVAPPQAFSYSAVARDGFGNPLVNQNVGIQFSILKGSTVGPIQYQENHFTTTNQFGLFTLLLGTGAVQQGIFANINWGSDAYYLKVGLDAIGGTNFAAMGTTQFLSVPYALYAANANNNNDHDTSATNELQNLTVTGNTLQISQGNQVVLPTVYDHDTSATNEIQTLSLIQDTLKISGGNKLVLPYNSQMSFTVKINGVSISDPTINHVMIGSYAFLTATNYRYDLAYDQTLAFNNENNTSPLSDSIKLINSEAYTALYTTNTTCSGQKYAGGTVNYEAISPGRIFYYGNIVYYIPLNAVKTNLNAQSYVDPDNACNTFAVNIPIAYPVYVNNPAVTGFNFGTGPLKLTFTR